MKTMNKKQHKKFLKNIEKYKYELSCCDIIEIQTYVEKHLNDREKISSLNFVIGLTRRDEDSFFMPRFIASGILEFTEKSAYHWAGPFPGNVCAFRIEDHSFAVYAAGPNKGKLYLDIYKKYREDNMRHNIFLDLPSMRMDDYPSHEKPISFHCYGNDDSSYTKFYATPEEALAELELFRGTQPLDFHEFIDFGFVFTN